MLRVLQTAVRHVWTMHVVLKEMAKSAMCGYTALLKMAVILLTSTSTSTKSVG
jgi:hypothetical protein